MNRDIYLAFIKLHILYHAGEEEVFGLGLIEELGRHGYKLGPGTLYPTLAKMEGLGYLKSNIRVVQQRRRKYYRITPGGKKLLKEVRVKLKELYQELIQGK